MVRETDLYRPVKSLLEAQGFEVKAEIGAADVVGVRPDAPHEPVIVELKTGFSLTLFHQAVARQAIADTVYVAVPLGRGKRWQASLRGNVTLCRRLGLGLVTVRLADGFCEVRVDPGPYRPRQSKPRKSRLLREFARREGDPNTGGATRTGIVTAYRQDAAKLARHLASVGPDKGARVAAATGVARATAMLAADHYGWFERVERGVYRLTPTGREALGD